jgi:oligoendopeptidase F
MKAIKDSWNLSLLYKGDNDPQIEKDMKAIEAAFAGFEKKYKGKDFTSSPSKLLPALKEIKDMHEKFGGNRPWRYFWLKSELDSSDEKALAKASSFEQRMVKAGNMTTFFDIVLGKIEPKRQKELLRSTELREFSHYLKRTFERAKYNMSEEEEKLAGLLSVPAYSMWLAGQEKLMSKQTVTFKGEVWPIEKAVGSLSSLPRADRRVLDAEVNKVLKSISPFAEAEVNAAYTYKKIMDERRGYPTPHFSTALSHENDIKTVDSLVRTVTKWFKLSQRFYKLHAKLLKVEKLFHADRAVLMAKIDRKFTFDESVGIVRKAFTRLDVKYADLLDRFLENGQIDAFPKQGKSGGAYCSGGTPDPTYILLNHTDSIRSVETLAHEMGHAIHTEFSASQPGHYSGYSTAVAEVASTLFENFATEEIESKLSERERIILLHNKLIADMSTVFRQIAFFNFEMELHGRIRKEGMVPKEEIAKLFNKHVAAYMGKSVELSEDTGYGFVHLGHMRWFFYVYSYAFGQLVSRALYEKWKEDKSFEKKIEQFLRAGSSKSPKDIFKSIGVDISDPAFFEAGLKGIENDLKKLERLSKKAKA